MSDDSGQLVHPGGTSSPAHVIVKTPEELRAWRTELLQRARMSYEELRDRADSGALGPEERDIYETVRSIDYLLSDQTPIDMGAMSLPPEIMADMRRLAAAVAEPVVTPPERDAARRLYGDHSTTQPDTDPAADVDELTPEQQQDLLEREAQRYFNMTAEEFAQRWRDGEFRENDDPWVARVAMLLPDARDEARRFYGDHSTHFACTEEVRQLLEHVPADDLRTFAAELITAIHASTSPADLRLLIDQWHNTMILFGDEQLLRSLTTPVREAAAEPAERPHVRVDPNQRFGKPNVKGISVEAIAEAVAAHEDVNEVAAQFGLGRSDVLVACWYAATYGPKPYRRTWAEWADTAVRTLIVGQWDYDLVPDPPQEPEA